MRASIVAFIENASPELPDVDSDAPTIDKVLSSEAKHLFPWEPRRFLAFLKTEFNEENMYFWEEIEALKSISGIKVVPPPPDDLLILPAAARIDPDQYVSEIKKMFILDRAQMQINISHTQRLDIVEGKSSMDALLLAQQEVRTLMLNGSWKRFVQAQLTTNMTAKDANRRAYWGYFWLAVSLLAFALFLGLFVPRWYFFLLVIPYVACAVTLNSARSKLCPQCAVSGIAPMTDCSGEQVIVCKFVKKETRRRAKRMLVLSVVLAAVLTVASFALTYAVEAGENRGVLYG